MSTPTYAPRTEQDARVILRELECGPSSSRFLRADLCIPHTRFRRAVERLMAAGKVKSIRDGEFGLTRHKDWPPFKGKLDDRRAKLRWMLEHGAELSQVEATAALGAKSGNSARVLNSIPGVWRYHAFYGSRRIYRWTLSRPSNPDEAFAVKHCPERYLWPYKNNPRNDLVRSRAREILQWMRVSRLKLADMAGCSGSVACLAMDEMGVPREGVKPCAKGSTVHAVHQLLLEGVCTRKALLKALPDVPSATISRSVQALAKQGMARIVRRGEYEPILPLGERIVRMLVKRGPLTSRQLSLILEVPRFEVSDNLTDLADSGAVDWSPGSAAVLT